MTKINWKIFKFILPVGMFFLVSGISQAGAITDATEISTVLSNALEFLLSIFAILATISLIVSGILYFLSAGDVKRQEGAKRSAQYSIIGIVIGLSESEKSLARLYS